MIDFGRFSHVSFDCYGTLIDWETGILGVLRPTLERHGVQACDDRLLGLFARHEAEQEGGSYRSYRSVLSSVMAGIAGDLGLSLTDEETSALPESVGDWPAFDDTRESLAGLAERYPLVILSNVDDDLFERTRAVLGMDFSEVVTAEQVRSYKPGHAHFETALRRLGIEAGGMLHVAQSPYHDHVPARQLGFTTVWVNRPSLREGQGATVPADARPDLEVPSLAALVAELGAAAR